jgi:hypothetical protein
VAIGDQKTHADEFDRVGPLIGLAQVKGGPEGPPFGLYTYAFRSERGMRVGAFWVRQRRQDHRVHQMFYW